MTRSESLRPRALVLTAGLGTRLRPLTYVRAKAAVPVNGEPLVRRIVRWLAGWGIDDLVLNLHHRPATITAAVGDGSELGVRVRYSWEQPVLGSAGGPRHALPLLCEGDAGASGSFLIVNGDTLTDVDVRALVEAHEASGAQVTMALIPNPQPEKYGGVLVSEEGWVTGFTRPGGPAGSYHFVGVQVASPAAFLPLDDGVPAESVGALYRQMIAADPRSIAGFVCPASFRDIGTPADYLDTSLALAALEGDRLRHGTRVDIAPSASLGRTAVWDDVRIGERVRLTDCIVCDGVHVPDGTVLEGCAVVPATAGPAEAGDRLVGEMLVRPFLSTRPSAQPPVSRTAT